MPPKGPPKVRTPAAEAPQKVRVPHRGRRSRIDLPSQPLSVDSTVPRSSSERQKHKSLPTSTPTAAQVGASRFPTPLPAGANAAFTLLRHRAMSIDAAIADAVTRSTVALTQEEEAALSRQVSHRVAQLDAEQILRELIDDLGRQRVQQTLDALS